LYHVSYIHKNFCIMPKTSTSSANRTMSSFRSSVSSMNSEEILSYVCVTVIGLFIIIAKPENTAVFFSHPAVKALLFVIVAAVVYADVKVGMLFGIAVTLTLVYSHMTAAQLSEERFDGHQQGGGDDSGGALASVTSLADGVDESVYSAQQSAVSSAQQSAVSSAQQSAVLDGAQQSAVNSAQQSAVLDGAQQQQQQQQAASADDATCAQARQTVKQCDAAAAATAGATADAAAAAATAGATADAAAAAATAAPEVAGFSNYENFAAY
jgi:hypothetical protein